ncbi:T3SS effector HopA1 family protein [Streptomyces sp. NPDC004111]|uniref:T3SS effector HopA1 family protein n=1 Tax=Streptomyces sp. NPDC004111 TaxID=3364690 RepID=UPI0036CE23AE
MTVADAGPHTGTATSAVPRIAPRLLAALSRVTVTRDGTAANVSGRELTAENARDLRGRLTNALYEEFHAGRGAQRDEQGDTAPRRELRDPHLEARLAAGVPHTRTPFRARLVEVLHRPDGDQLVVRLPDITARIPADRLLTEGAPVPGDVVEVALESARPALSPGFFYVMGSRALPGPAGPVRRLFLHAVDADGAVALWTAALDALERAEALYHAKVLSDPDDFPRRDGLVVYLHGEHERAERAVVEAVRSLTGNAGTAVAGADTSLFTERLAPGVAAAWDPRDPRPGQGSMSFGQHRSFALATALIDHALSGETGPDALEARVVREFRAAGIDPLRPENNIPAPGPAPGSGSSPGSAPAPVSASATEGN